MNDSSTNRDVHPVLGVMSALPVIANPYPMSALEISIPSSIEIPVPILIAILLILITAFVIREKRAKLNILQKIASKSNILANNSGTLELSTSFSNDLLTANQGLATLTPNPISTHAPISRSLSYRMEEENSRKSSSEFTRRGQLWSKHASWNLPNAPRVLHTKFGSKPRYAAQGMQHVLSILSKYNVDPRRGFLPSQDPLQRLPYARYHLWEDLADDLPKLLGARMGQARGPLRQLPILKTDKLVTDAELRRAHLLLCLFAHAYIWGGPEPLDVIPEGIAVPLWEVAKRLDMPPVLGHPSIVLYNWRRLDAEADICMENLSTLNNFFDGRDESWFYLITVELEQRGAASVVPMMLLIDAVQRYQEETKHTILNRNRAESILSATTEEDLQQTPDPIDLYSEDDNSCDDIATDSQDAKKCFREEEALPGELTEQRVAAYVSVQLRKVADAIGGMCLSMGAMREGCHPFIFFHRVRPFLSAWKNNPTLPNGVIYQGVSLERHQFYGGSAAQSSLLPFLDVGLGVSHESTKSQEFLLHMREYMPSQHRKFLEYLESVACVRQFIIDRLACHGITSDMKSDSSQSMESHEAHRSHLGGRGNQCKQGSSAGTSTETAVPKEQRADKDTKIWLELRDAYDACVDNLQAFRSCHMAIVADYIIAQQKKGVDKDTLEGSAGGKGTGGTDLMKFLKPIRDNCGDSLLAAPACKAENVPCDSSNKKNERSEEIKLTEECVNSDKPCADRGWKPSTADPVIVTLSQQ